MTLIDQFCGGVSQATYRKVPFTLTVGDWQLDDGQYVVDFATAYVTDTSDDNVQFSSSIVGNAQAHIIWEKKSGGGGIIFTTAVIPTGTITGVIKIFDNEDGKVPVLIEDTVVPIANGGTGESTLNGAKETLGINDLSDYVGDIGTFSQNSRLESSDMTGSNIDVITKSYTPKTNRILVIGTIKAYCQVSTNVNMYLKCGTNSQLVCQVDGYGGAAGYQNMFGMYVFDVTPNEAVNVVLNFTSGNSNSKISAYNRQYLNIIDL
jgi:hypothetical protein